MGLNRAPALSSASRALRGCTHFEVELPQGGQPNTSHNGHQGQVHQGGEGLLEEDGAVRDPGKTRREDMESGQDKPRAAFGGYEQPRRG